MNIKTEIAALTDLDWINSQYDIVNFKHSTLEDEVVLIITVDGKKAGLGRLQKIDYSTAELGGIYIQDNYRGFGLASKIVSKLITLKENYNTIYCLPFAHLANFYSKFGFKEVLNVESSPHEITKKLKWCNSTYSNKTLLFKLTFGA